MAGSGRNAVNFIKQDTPKFIQDFKKKTNQEDSEHSIDSKKQHKHTEDEDKEREDEAPTVSIGQGVSEEEAKEFMKASYGEKGASQISPNVGEKRGHDAETEEEPGKVLFKKPEKTKASEKPKSKMKKVNNSNLLSFDEEEDE